MIRVEFWTLDHYQVGSRVMGILPRVGDGVEIGCTGYEVADVKFILHAKTPSKVVVHLRERENLTDAAR